MAKSKIVTEKEYNLAMRQIDLLMKKGEQNLTNKEVQELHSLALAAEAYEQNMYSIPKPKTLGGILELKMYEKRIKQKDLAKELGISEAKLSLIASGKQRPDIAFLKAAHANLGIDGNDLLSALSGGIKNTRKSQQMTKRTPIKTATAKKGS